MGKRGGNKHLKRIAVSKAVPIHDKKAHTWMIRAQPGPHPLDSSVPLGVLLRDVLKFVLTLREAKRVLAENKVLVDGKVRRDVHFPVGLMDVLSFPTLDKHYKLSVDDHGRLVPVEISKEEAQNKLVKVVGKKTVKGGKISLALHDGRNLLADNNVKVGDSLLLEVPSQKLLKHFKRDLGVTCLITEGKHAGKEVVLKELIERKGRDAEALVSHGDDEFVTVAKYLFVVGGSNA